MPACLTHYTFAKMVTPPEEKEYFDAIALGTQGSDPFFYYGILPFWSGPDKKEMQDVGERIHHEEIAFYYPRFIEYALKSEKKEMLFAYIDALWMHYCVDRNIHPYVFARSGIGDSGKLTGYYKFSHGCFEAVLDCYFSRKYGKFTKTSATIKVNDDDLMEISRMWYVLHDVFPILTEDSFFRAAKAYKGVEGVLWSRTGLKRILFRIVGKHSLAYGMSYPKFYRRFDYIDVLNESHAEWSHPVTGQAKNDSIEDLLKKAKKDYQVVHSILMKAKNGDDRSADFLRFVSKLNHDGFIYLSEIRHYNLCWKKGE